MLLRSLHRATAAAPPLKQSLWQISVCRSMAAKPPKPANPTKGKKPPSKFDNKEKRPEELQAMTPEFAAKEEAELRRRLLAEDEKNPALDIGPNCRPLFTSASSLSLLTKDDTNSYFKFSMEELKEVLPEGLPVGMMKEFEASSRSAVLVRQSFIDLRDNFRRVADPSLVVNSKVPKVRKQIVLDGPVGCGKGIALAMLVHWARKEGWLVLYVPDGQAWTDGGLFYKNPQTSLWDTPLQAGKILQDFLKYNKSCLQGLKCNIHYPIPLGEGAGVGRPKGRDKMPISEGTTLCQLVEAGISNTHAAVGVVVRLRHELSKVTSVPVLIAIDRYDCWFEITNLKRLLASASHQPRPGPIDAGDIATVKAFRSMMHDDMMMVGAFSQLTAKGPEDLPGVPASARIDFPSYSLDEAATVCHYYLRQRLVKREAFSEEKWWKIFYLTNGEGTMMRALFPSMQKKVEDEANFSYA